MATVFVHVGPHKTGTTGIQNTFYANRALLEAHGVYFPSAGLVPAVAAHHQLAWEGGDANVFNPSMGGAMQLVEEISDKDRVFVSSEVFSSYPGKYPEFVGKLKAAGHEVRTIFTFRHQIEIINSAYTQRVKTFNLGKSFDDYLPDALREARYNVGKFYKPILSKENSPIVLSYSRRNLIADLCRALGLGPEIVSELEEWRTEQKTPANESPLAFEVEFLLLNQNVLKEKGANFRIVPRTLLTQRSQVPWGDDFWGFSDDQFDRATSLFQKVNRKFAKQYGLNSADMVPARRSRSVFSREHLSIPDRERFDRYSEAINRLLAAQGDFAHFVEECGPEGWADVAVLWREEDREFANRTLRTVLRVQKKYGRALAFLDALSEQQAIELIAPALIKEVFDHSVEDERWKGRLGEAVRKVQPNAKLIGIVGPEIRDSQIPLHNEVVEKFPAQELDAGYRKRFLEFPHSSFEHIGVHADSESRSVDDIRMLTFRNVSLVGLDFGFAVVGQNGRLSDFSSPYANEYVLEKVNRCQAQAVSKLFFFGDMFRPNNYCHFVVDHLPRLITGRDACPDFAFGVFHLENSSFQRAYFEALGVDDRVMGLKQDVVYEVEELKLLETSGRPYRHVFQDGHPLYAAGVRDFADQAARHPKQPHKRVFLSRAENIGRGLSNEHEVLQLLNEFDFEAIDPGALSIGEQIGLMKQVDVLFGVHGAALTNALFCKEGTKVLELFPPLYGTNAFMKVSELAGCDYTPIIGMVDDSADATNGYAQLPFYADMTKLRSVFEQELGR